MRTAFMRLLWRGQPDGRAYGGRLDGPPDWQGGRRYRDRYRAAEFRRPGPARDRISRDAGAATPAEKESALDAVIGQNPEHEAHFFGLSRSLSAMFRVFSTPLTASFAGRSSPTAQARVARRTPAPANYPCPRAASRAACRCRAPSRAHVRPGSDRVSGLGTSL